MNPESEMTGLATGKDAIGPVCPEPAAQKDSSVVEGRWRIAAWAIWVIPMLVICIMVATRPEKRTVTHLYHAAVQRWAAHQPLYDGPAGMNYLPQFSVLFAPWAFLGRVPGDILWRCAAAAGFFAGTFLLCRGIWKENPWRALVFASLLMLPLGLPALRNGQANAHMGAVLLLAAWALQAERWNLAAALLCLSVGIKPIGVAAVGLAFAVYPRLWWRLGLGLGLLAGMPFLFGPPDYVWSQFVAAGQNLRQCSEVTEHRFADLNGLLRTAGWPLAGKASLVVRLLAALLFASICFFGCRRRDEPVRALAWLGVSATFLMLFNPMTEANSYAILAPVLALFALVFFRAGDPRGWLLVVMALSMGLLPNLLHAWLGNAFALAWHPAMGVVFVALLFWEVLRAKRETPSPVPA